MDSMGPPTKSETNPDPPRVLRAYRLRGWDKFRFPKGRIEILAGKRAGSIVELDRVVATLGKRGDRLAVLTRRPHGYFITHVEGRRCPRVNGQSVGKEARMLQNGDIIEFADEKLQFLME